MIERIEIDRGLAVPIEGEPSQEIDTKSVSRVAVVGDDYVGMRPTLQVSEGDNVQLGQQIFTDKKTEGVVYTAPASGRVQSINRGAKRRFLSVIIELQGEQESIEFDSTDVGQLASLDRKNVVERLVKSGLWLSLRKRPFSKIPSPEVEPPAAIFINAMETNPLGFNPELVIRDNVEDFKAGIEVVSRLTEGTVYLSRRPSSQVPGEGMPRVHVAEFEGPHPAGLVGTHMHFLKPVTAGRHNWYLNYQDTIAIGRLFLTGRIDPVRTVSLAGPSVKNPRLIRTRLGANLTELVDGELTQTGELENRVVSGSVLCGRTSREPVDFLGRFHLQISCLPEGTTRELFGWQMPGFDRFSVTRAFASAWTGPKKFAMTTSTGGSERAMVPIGTYEKVMPLDLIPTPLLRSLISRDTDSAQELGCLELDEEDLGLCTFVCPGKYEYGEILRDNLLKIEKEG